MKTQKKIFVTWVGQGFLISDAIRTIHRKSINWTSSKFCSWKNTVRKRKKKNIRKGKRQITA